MVEEGHTDFKQSSQKAKANQLERKQPVLQKASSIASILESKGSQKDLINKSNTLSIDKMS